MSIDRTREFLALVDAAAGAKGAAGAAAAGSKPHAALRPPPPLSASGAAAAPAAAAFENRSAFIRAVREVSSDLNRTSLKLAALTKRESGDPRVGGDTVRENSVQAESATQQQHAPRREAGATAAVAQEPPPANCAWQLCLRLRCPTLRWRVRAATPRRCVVVLPSTLLTCKRPPPHPPLFTPQLSRSAGCLTTPPRRWSASR